MTVTGLPLLSALSLQAAINASIDAKEPSFIIPAGAYYFDDGSPLLIYRAKSWALRANGTVELWFRATETWRTGGVLVKECDSISITGLTVDYDPPAYYQGTVTGLVPREVQGADHRHHGDRAKEDSEAALMACYRRMDVTVSSCAKASGVTLHQLNRRTGMWSTVADTNCYTGHGASVVPGPEPWPCCHDNATGAKHPKPVTLDACRTGCSSDPQCSAIITGPHVGPPRPPAPRPSNLADFLVQTDKGFPEPHEYEAMHARSRDPSDDDDATQLMIWPKSIGFSCNRTMGCPGHFKSVLYPLDSSRPAGLNRMQLLASAEPGDKITISMRKGITWHVQNSSNVSTIDVSIHSASLFGLSEFDGRGAHSYRNVFLGRRPVVPGSNKSLALCGRPPGRLCWGVLASNADAFHSSGCKRGAQLINVTLSNNMDDFLNVHSRVSNALASDCQSQIALASTCLPAI